MGVYRGCDVPEELYFDVANDVWARVEEDGDVTLGMTDPAQTRCGKFVNLRFKKVGRHVERGQSLVTIESAKWVGPFPAVVAGEIIAINEAAFAKDILAANKDPYGAGWLVRMRPEDFEGQRSQLLTGPAAVARYQARIDELEIHCFRCAGGDDAND